jgi:hypothetical protein
VIGIGLDETRVARSKEVRMMKVNELVKEAQSIVGTGIR